MNLLRRIIRSNCPVSDLKSEDFLNLINFDYRKTFIFTKCQDSSTNKCSSMIQNEAHDFSLVLRKTESLQSSNFVRNLLYPETEDELINNLKTCSSVEDVLRIIENNESLNKQQIAQVILILRDLQKLHLLQTQFNMLEDDSLLVSEINSHPTFLKLLDLVEESIPNMNLSEMTSCLLYLTKFDKNMEKSVLLKLVYAVEKCLLENHDLPLSDFARFFMTLTAFYSRNNSLWLSYCMNNLTPIIVKRLENCDNYHDFRQISICFQKCYIFLNDYHIQLYLSKANSLLLNQTNLNEIDRVRTALKAVLFLACRSSNDDCRNVMMALMKTLQGGIHNLCFQEVLLLQKVIFTFQEPYQLLKESDEIIKKNWFFDCKKNSEIPYIFQAAFYRMKLSSDEDVKKSLHKYLTQPSEPIDAFDKTGSLHYLLFNSNLKFDKEITDLYWLRAVKILSSNNDNYEDIFQILLKYVNFIRLQLELRNHYFENWITSYAIHSLKTNPVIQYSPRNYMRFIMAILIFHKQPFKIVDNDAFEKLLAIIPRLDIIDNLTLSIMLNVAKQVFDRKNNHLETFLRYYVYLISASNENVSNAMRNNPQIEMNKINMILFSHVLKDGETSSEIFERICDRLRSCSLENVCSRIIHDALYNLKNCFYLIPEFTDLAVEYCIEKKKDITETYLSSILNYCYSFGYEPKRIDEFLPIAQKCIYENKVGLGISKYIRSVNALNYFGELPSTFSDHIFNIEFLQKVDEKCTKMNMKGAAFTKRELMILNRTMCIQYPFREIPWFHERFCKEQNYMRGLEFKTRNVFFVNVLNTLKCLINNNECIETDFLSSYGHVIDIVVYLDKSGRPTNPHRFSSNKLRKVAIILIRGSPQQYYPSKGPTELLMRELEILDFEVKLLTKHHWYCMYMSEPMAKMNYLRKLISLNVNESVSP